MSRIPSFPLSDATAGSSPTTAQNLPQKQQGGCMLLKSAALSGLTGGIHQSVWNHEAMLRYTASEE